MAGPWEKFAAPSAPSASPEGPWSKFQQPAAAEPAPGMGETAARSAVQGLTFGLADESYGLTQGIKGMLTGEGFSAGYDRGVTEFRGKEKAGKEANPITATAAEIAGGMGTGLGLARGGVTLMRQGMGLGQMTAAGAGEGAIYGAVSGAANAEGGLDERLKGAQQGAVVGTAVGGAVPLVARGIGALTSRAITPMTIPPERQAMIDTLGREGIPLSAGQRTGSKGLQYAESVLGDAPFVGSGQRMMGEQAEAFTDAVMRRAGGSGRALPDNVQGNFDRVGKAFEDLSARNTLRADRQFGTDLRRVLTEYDKLLPAEQKTIVGSLANDLVERLKAGNGTMPGDEYQAIRSWLSTASQKEGNQYVASAMKGLRDALDNNMMRSISPDDAKAWQAARKEYGNLKDIASAAGGAGENAASGLISPQALRGATASGKNRELYARGKGDFAELARAGNAVMTPLPNSGTAQRSLVTGMAGSGGATAAMTGDPLVAAIVALGPSAFGKALWSGPVQRYLSNQTITPQVRALIESRARAALQGGAQTQSDRLLPAR